MKITAFNPIIASKDPESVIKLFEALGFQRSHQKDQIDGKDITDVRLKDENGFHVDVSSAGKILPEPHDYTIIRINVDDFDEAYDFFLKRGFIDVTNKRGFETATSKETILISKTGLGFRLIQHIK